MKFELHDFRESNVWKEANEEGAARGKNTERKGTIQKCLAKGMTHKQIAELLEIPVQEVREVVAPE